MDDILTTSRNKDIEILRSVLNELERPRMSDIIPTMKGKVASIAAPYAPGGRGWRTSDIVYRIRYWDMQKRKPHELVDAIVKRRKVGVHRMTRSVGRELLKMDSDEASNVGMFVLRGRWMNEFVLDRTCVKWYMEFYQVVISCTYCFAPLPLVREEIEKQAKGSMARSF